MKTIITVLTMFLLQANASILSTQDPIFGGLWTAEQLFGTKPAKIIDVQATQQEQDLGVPVGLPIIVDNKLSPESLMYFNSPLKSVNLPKPNIQTTTLSGSKPISQNNLRGASPQLNTASPNITSLNDGSRISSPTNTYSSSNSVTNTNPISNTNVEMPQRPGMQAYNSKRYQIIHKYEKVETLKPEDILPRLQQPAEKLQQDQSEQEELPQQGQLLQEQPEEGQADQGQAQQELPQPEQVDEGQDGQEQPEQEQAGQGQLEQDQQVDQGQPEQQQTNDDIQQN